MILIVIEFSFFFFNKQSSIYKPWDKNLKWLEWLLKNSLSPFMETGKDKGVDFPLEPL